VSTTARCTGCRSMQPRALPAPPTSARRGGGCAGAGRRAADGGLPTRCRRAGHAEARAAPRWPASPSHLGGAADCGLSACTRSLHAAPRAGVVAHPLNEHPGHDILLLLQSMCPLDHLKRAPTTMLVI
jgi:hypothetical protein